MYRDNTIEFDLSSDLTGPKKFKVRNDLLSWYFETKYLFASIWIEFGKDSDVTRQKIVNSKTIDGFTISYGFQETVIEGRNAYYCLETSVPQGPNGIHVPRALFSISCGEYSLCVQVSDGCSGSVRLDLDRFLPFIASIKIIDVEKLKEKYDNVCMKIARRVESTKNKKILFDIPPGMSQENVLHDHECIRIKNSEMTIEIYDLSGLGRESDIDIYYDQKEAGEESDDTCLFPLPRKRCLVKNMLEGSLDFSRCKNVSLLLAFRDRCYGIMIESKVEFDLYEYKDFVGNIGEKVKSPK